VIIGLCQCSIFSFSFSPKLKVVIVYDYQEKSCEESGESAAENNFPMQVDPQLGKERVEEDDREQAEDAEGAENCEDMSRIVLTASSSKLPTQLPTWDLSVDSLVIHLLRL